MGPARENRPEEAGVIGVDFDNTLVSYDALFHRLALAQGLIEAAVAVDKRAVRDRVRQSAAGDLAWQRLQAEAYGPGIGQARLIPGVAEFLRACRQAGRVVQVISHKTRYAGQDRTGTDLRQAALGWMREQGLLDPEDLGLDEERVHFEPTRQDKVERIQALGCAVFIDDLVETFREPGFPPAVAKILFCPGQPPETPPGLRVARDWREVHELVLHGGH